MAASIEPGERYPTLTDAGRATLALMREHPHAPVYRNESGNRLLAAEVDALREFGQQVADARVGWAPGTLPAWLGAFIDEVYAQVPYYRQQGSAPRRFQDIEPVGRADLAEDVTRFVPDHLPLERLLNFRTTGTTGHPLQVPSHPIVAARYLAFHQRALARAGVQLRHGAGQVGVVLLGFQQRCFTYVSVNPTLNESGLAKINLHPNDWRDPADRAPYLDALHPEVVAGDPISFAELLTLPITFQPRALMSVSMTLMPGLRAQLEARFGCPVLDLYSLNEVGPVAVWDADCNGHLLLQDRLYVELLDAQAQPVPMGARGEITVTGGFNDWLPLLRYRTGDHASLAFGPDGPVLLGLMGRAPVRYRTARGTWINNIEISHALAPLPLAHYAFHQAADGALELLLAPGAMNYQAQATQLLGKLFDAQPITVKPLRADDKIRQYTSALAGALA